VTLLREDDYGFLPPHIQPEVRHAVTFPQVLTALLVVEALALIIIPDWWSQPAAWLLFGLSMPPLGWLIFRHLVIKIVFTTPEPVSGRPTDPRWAPFRFTGWGGDVKTAHLLEGDNSGSDLVVVLHGRGSSLRRIETRAQHISELGATVVGLNLRGHGECDRRTDWTLLKVVEDIEAMMESLEHELGGNLPERVWFYGHSVGGFLSLWFGANPTGWWQERLSGIMLESPATSFPLAVESLLPPHLRAFMPWVRQILRREYERIHPNNSIRYATAQVPHFGMPTVPTLLLQATRDDRLGREHFNLLTSHLDGDASVHLLASQPHTSEVDSEERKNVLEEWLAPRLGNAMEGLV